MGNRILLADDSITIQKVVNLTFADEGIEVVSVSNGDMAERRMSEVNPDLVLADIFMPGKNGYELCESIKQSPQFSNVPVVLLVGAFEPFDQAEARRVRADAHLTKPFESRTLVETVRKLINSSGHLRTGSLSPAAPAAQPGERQEAHGPTAQPSLTTTPAQASNERAPLAQDQQVDEDLQPLEIQLAPAPDQDQSDLSSELPWMEQTESLTDVGAAQGQTSDPFDLMPLEVSAQEAADGPPVVGVEATDEHDLMPGDENIDLNLEGPEPEFPAGFAVDDDEMILELGRPEDVYMPEAENASAADVASEGAFNFNSGALQGEAIRASSWADSDVFKTQMLEPPAHLSHAEGRINTNPLEMPPASDFNRSSLSPAGFAELHEERSSSTLLAVDDPLGDVLVDEREMDVPSYDSRHAPQVLFGEQVANEEFDLEFNPQEQQVFDIPGPTATAAGMTGGLAETDNHISEESPLAIETIEQAADAYAAREGAVAEARQQSPDEAVEAASGFEPFGAAPIDAAPSDLNADWSGFGAEFGSEFQTSTSERHPNQAGYTFDEPEEGLDQNHGTAPGAAFTTSSMWDEQDARFAPIDIEATPVDEFERGRGMADHGAVETGFEIAPAMEEGPTHLAGAPVAQASQDAQPAKAEADAHTADLSPALVDEIVRRVVSQMSESVVREIAWEVVPDVVERVIKEMARNEVSKRN